MGLILANVMNETFNQKFQLGEHVRVVRDRDHWSPIKKETVGQIGVVKSFGFSSPGYTLKISGQTEFYLEDFLERVEE